LEASPVILKIVSPDVVCICNGEVGLGVPIPTLLPVIVIAGEEYLPITTRSSSKTSRIGMPDTSDTDIRDPEKLSEIPNKEPDAPEKFRDPLGSTNKSIVFAADPENPIFADPGVILISFPIVISYI